MGTDFSTARTINLAMTGASGAQYGLRLLHCLVEQGCRVNVMISKAARVVLATETEVRVPGSSAGALKALSEYTGATELESRL